MFFFLLSKILINFTALLGSPLALGIISVLICPGLKRFALILNPLHSFEVVKVKTFNADLLPLYKNPPGAQFRGAPEVTFIILPKLFFFSFLL